MMNITTGKEKSINEKYCSECGEIINLKAEICPKCGVRQMLSLDEAPNGKNKTAAALFAIFLGGFGIHRFYLGQAGLGFFYLLFCWTLIPACIALIDFILLVSMSNNEFIKRYGAV
ncbi:MAG: TM2 domain-containing protein [Fibrobacterales bacterium]